MNRLISGLEKYVDRVDYDRVMASDVQSLVSDSLYEFDLAVFYLDCVARSDMFLTFDLHASFPEFQNRFMRDIRNAIHCLEEVVFFLDVIESKKLKISSDYVESLLIKIQPQTA